VGNRKEIAKICYFLVQLEGEDWDRYIANYLRRNRGSGTCKEFGGESIENRQKE